jgi:hypothetical protein
MGNGWGSVKHRQNIPQLANMFRVYAARVALFKKPFQSLVADCPYHPCRNLTRGACQEQF